MRIGIVGHTSRQDQIDGMATYLKPDVLSVDDGSLGCDCNHRFVWMQLESIAAEHEWCLVLEDDAVLVPNFLEELKYCVDHSPEPIVSLYLGQLFPPQWQPRIRSAISQARALGRNWICTATVIHAVAVMIKGKELIAEMLKESDPKLPIDQSMTYWIHFANRYVAYSIPSLVNHRDGPSIAHHPDGINRQRGRVAWHFGVPARWDTGVVTM
jgi:GR25 family glycosyltransferase involved in LPS biosynthesis